MRLLLREMQLQLQVAAALPHHLQQRVLHKLGGLYHMILHTRASPDPEITLIQTLDPNPNPNPNTLTP